MSLYVGIIGIDGSGKSTVTTALADLAAAELGVTTASVGDDVRVKTPQEDLLLPDLPDGEMISIRLGRWFRARAKMAAHSPRLYPPLKLAHLAAQQRTVANLAARYHPEIIFSDGNLILSSAGRGINYPKSGSFALSPSEQIRALYDHLIHDKRLPPELAGAVHGVKFLRALNRLDRAWKLRLMELPDALIFLDIDPEIALERRTKSGTRLDRHENVPDMTNARIMYRNVVEFFRQQRGDDCAIVIDVSHSSIEQTLWCAIEFVHSVPPQSAANQAVGERLGTTDEKLEKKTTLIRKIFTFRYLVRYFLPNLTRGSAREMTFPFSPLGRLFLKEGYSAGVMKTIYEQEHKRYGALDRIFLDYPLHRAVYHRLKILQPIVERELRERLSAASQDSIRILTAPSGYSFDLFPPLLRLAEMNPEWSARLNLLASDLDPDGRIENELVQWARQAGVTFQFLRGDLTASDMRARFAQSAPYDLVLFVGLSSWIPKPHLLTHLKLIRKELLAQKGALITDVFTPHAYALSGKYAGYKANYYTPRDFTNILAYAGFDPDHIQWQSESEGINHVCVARAA